MTRIGITGQSGFIGSHLYNTLALYPDKFIQIPFVDEFFNDKTLLENFVSNCDVIIHLAAINRHPDPDVLLNKNIELVKQVIEACEITGSKPHILFSSSIQEKKDNHYGISKKTGRELFEKWAIRNEARFTGFVIPNVYGPFGNPYYNSVVATFCHQLTHNEAPFIHVDGEINLIYVSDLIKEIIQNIEVTTEESSGKIPVKNVEIPFTEKIKVSELLEILQSYKNQYFEKGEIPSLNCSFERNLFNTFLCYIDHKTFFPNKLKMNIDQRGSFVEMIKLNSGGQVSFSTTRPGVTRGNHFHTRKAERFAVIKGKARIELRRFGTDKKISFELNGTEPAFVDMPIWYTHNITNIGEEELYTLFWINEHFDVNDPDTFFNVV